jgi:hypothetical protein
MDGEDLSSFDLSPSLSPFPVGEDIEASDAYPENKDDDDVLVAFWSSSFSFSFVAA